MNDVFRWIARNPIKFGVLAFLFGFVLLAAEVEVIALIVKSVFVS